MSESPRVPSYRRHKQSGQAIVTLPDGLGGRHDVLLGKYGTPESRQEYVRVLGEWEANGRRLPGSSPFSCNGLTVNELILAYWSHVETRYRRPDGTPTSEVAEFRRALRVVRELYARTVAKDFGPLALKATRQKMVEGGVCRGVVNQRVGRVKRMFRWGVENELVPPSVYQGLQAVRGLERGRSDARETKPVGPVSEAAVNDTLPYLNRHTAGMVRVQLLTGARPGEVCRMRTCDIDMTGKVWLYRPGSDEGPHGAHKTAHHGHQRVIAIGPKAQAIIKEFLTLDTQTYLFSPRRAMEEKRVERRRNRKTKLQPSQRSRRKQKPKRAPGERYTTGAFDHAIRQACLKAGITPWHPHQLRHARATQLRREFGLDTARTVLGHRSPAVTEVYAELDTSKAAEVMAKLG
jgi:integrase